MKRLLAVALLGAVVCAAATVAQDKKDKGDREKGPPMIGHMVYFQLKDNSPAARQKLVDACEKYLDGHEGTAFFAAGVISDDFKRDVNDREWDVALHMVFRNKAAHDKYQDHPRHVRFIDENKENWKKVRVFDSEFNRPQRKDGDKGKEGDRKKEGDKKKDGDKKKEGDKKDSE